MKEGRFFTHSIQDHAHGGGHVEEPAGKKERAVSAIALDVVCDVLARVSRCSRYRRRVPCNPTLCSQYSPSIDFLLANHVDGEWVLEDRRGQERGHRPVLKRAVEGRGRGGCCGKGRLVVCCEQSWWSATRPGPDEMCGVGRKEAGRRLSSLLLRLAATTSAKTPV